MSKKTFGEHNCRLCNEAINLKEGFYACTECEQYDLCNECYEQKGHNHTCYREHTDTYSHQESIALQPNLSKKILQIFLTYSTRPCVGIFNKYNELKYITYLQFLLMTLRFSTELYPLVFKKTKEKEKKEDENEIQKEKTNEKENNNEKEEKKKKIIQENKEKKENKEKNEIQKDKNEKKEKNENKENEEKKEKNENEENKEKNINKTEKEPKTPPKYRPTKKQPFVILCSENRLEFLFADYSCIFLGIATVPILPDSSSTKIRDICQKVDPVLIICTNKTKHSFQDQDIPLLNIDDLNYNHNFGTEKQTMTEIGELRERYIYDSKPDEIYTIMFTSGSTGKPKGAIFRNETWKERVCCRGLIDTKIPQPYILYLFTNLGYCGARETFPITIFYGARLAICSEVSKIFEQVKIASPSLFTSTPRIYEILYSRFQEELATNLEENKKKPKEDQKKGEEEIRKLLIAKYSMAFGDRVNFVFTGGAKTSKKIFRFLQMVFGEDRVFDAFGTTEVGSITTDNQVLKSADVKLVNVPEMNYYVSEGCGEICVKTKEMVKEYWKDEEATKNNFTNDGYFRTGDIGKYIDGKLIIIDRIKDTIKLSQGVFVSLNYLEEHVFKQSKMIHQIFIYGCPDYSFLVAIIVPSKEHLKSSKKQFANELKAIAEQSEISAFEIPKEMHIETEIDFTIENGLLSVAGKKSRGKIFLKYKQTIDNMLNNVDERISNTSNKINLEDESNLEEYLAQTLQVTELALDKSVHHQGGDSLTKYLISKTIKRKYSLDIPKFLFFLPVRQFIQYIKETSSRSEIYSKYGDEINWPLVSSLEHWFPQEVQKELFYKGKEKPVNKDFKTVFLTGATGFLGIHILEDLLNLTKLNEVKKVYCLIRSDSDENATKRLNLVLQQSKITLTEKQLSRVHLIAGDLAEDYLGLTKEKFIEIANDCDLVIHSGAHVDSVLPYKMLERANVGGTAEIIKLAMVKKIPVSYISTISIFFFTNFIDEYENPFLYYPSMQVSGYTQTKWVAEKLIQYARQKFKLPAIIYRPNSIFANSKTGYLPKKDLICRIVTGILKMKLFVDDPDCSFDLLPVDFYSKVIVNSTFNNFDKAYKMIGINFSNPLQTQLETLLMYYQKTRDVKLEKCDYFHFQKKLKNQINNPLAPLNSLFQNGPLPRTVKININGLKSILNEIKIPLINDELLDIFFKNVKEIIN
ncbi:fatty acid coa synthetase family [Anaeramoeba flamelloides]|uniref:Fatty acid coa synthetase family n=1 Tax=Anaeramoeba flamelloides TaxID=1746091 RepID=A0AAV7ZYB7_9EUKA|nr:fatty acid coa synthetase family [Anaeramoeba flamelloides]